MNADKRGWIQGAECLEAKGSCRLFSSAFMRVHPRFHSFAFCVLCVICGFSAAGEPDGQEVRVVPLEHPEQPLDAAAPPSRFNVPDGEALWSAAWNRASKTAAEQGRGFFNGAELVGEGFRSAKGFKCEKFSEGESGGELVFTLTADEAVKEKDEVRLANMRLAYFINRALPPQPGPQGAGVAGDRPDRQKKGRGPADRPQTGKAAREAHAPQEPRAKKAAPKGAAAPHPSLSPEGRGWGEGGAFQVLITAPAAVIDVLTNEGRASGQVTVEVFPLGTGAAGQASSRNAPIAVMRAERLAWRTWDEPRDGSTELAVYTGSTKPGEPDPVVVGRYVMAQPDGTNATLDLQGRGLVYEVGTYERPMPKEDEDGRTVGVSKTVHNQAMFHHEIKLVTTASTVQALVPGPGGLPPPNVPPKEAQQPATPATPSETIVLCGGPAVLNLAAVPRAETIKLTLVGQASSLPGDAGKMPAPQKAAPGGPPAQTGAAAADAKRAEGENSLPVLVPLARRFEFYNGVSVKQTPLPPTPSRGGEGAGGGPPEKRGAASGAHSDISSQHLCLQYPAGVVPGPATFPEYAEALGAVRMSGARMAEPAPGDAGPPRLVPYGVVCERVFYDGPKDSTYLVGSATIPAAVKDEKGEAFAQEFCYVRGTETLTMPARGPKKMVIKAVEPPLPQPPPATGRGQGEGVVPPVSAGSKAAGAISFGAGDTIILWRGPLSREVRHLPVPQQHDRIKEVLVLKEEVLIEQPAGGLKMRGQTIRVVRNMPAGDVEFLEGLGGVEALMGDLHALGETIAVDMQYGKDGALTKNLITVTGNREQGAKATLFTAGSAVRSDKFIIDRLADTFRTFGGAVAVVKSRPPPPTPSRGGEGARAGPAAQKPQAAQDAGAMFKGISFQGGGDLFLQCDGEFSQDAARRVTIKENVLIRQTESGGAYSELLADEVYLTLAEPAPASTAGVPPAEPSRARKQAEEPLPDGRGSGGTGAPARVTPAASAPGAPANAFFSGDFRSLEGLGKVEIRSPDQLVQCDRLTYDKEKDVTVLQVDDPDNDVRVYMSEESGGTRILSARKSLAVDGNSGKFTPGGLLVMLPYRAQVPAPRDRESSPVRKQKP